MSNRFMHTFRTLPEDPAMYVQATRDLKVPGYELGARALLLYFAQLCSCLQNFSQSAFAEDTVKRSLQ